MTEPLVGSLCTGYGGLDEAVISVFGGRLVWWADNADGPIAVMNRHHTVPNLGDVKTMPWAAVPRVDILTAGYPCQPFSNAGKRKGVDDPRHLWPHIARGIGALRPRIVILENVDAHLRRGFDVVLADLAVLGYDATWTIVRACDTGAPHRRKRLFVLAENTDVPTGNEWWPPAPQQAEGWRPRTHAGGRGGIPASDAEGHGRHQGGAESAREFRGPDAALGGGATSPDSGGTGPQIGAVEHHGPQRPAPQRDRRHGTAQPERWGDYADAIARWETVLGREAPDPTTTGQRGATVLSPVFVEWMMGLPPGYVTDTPGLSRNQMLTLLGNGVVPQQAEFAIRTLLPLLEVS